MIPNENGYKAYLEGHAAGWRDHRLGMKTASNPYEGGCGDWWVLGYKDGMKAEYPRFYISRRF